MKPVTGQVEVRGIAGIVEVGQGEREAVRHVSAYSARIVALVHAPEAAMTKPSDHVDVCRIPVHMSIDNLETDPESARNADDGAQLDISTRLTAFASRAFA